MNIVERFRAIDSISSKLFEFNLNDKDLDKKQIVSWIAETYEITTREAGSLFEDAKEELNKYKDYNQESSFYKAIRDREYLFRRAKEQENLKFALDVIKDRDKLLGLYSKDALASMEEGDISEMSAEEIKELIQKKYGN